MSYVPDAVPWSDRGALFKVANNADQTEWRSYLDGVAPTDSGVIDDVVADEHHLDLTEHDYSWEDEELALDQVNGDLIQEIERREELLGDLFYPYTREGASLSYQGSITFSYEFCLFASLQRDYSTGPFRQIPIIFELLAAEVARLYLGNAASAIRTGWPSHDSDERPSDFRDLMNLLNHRTEGEFCWNPCPPNDAGRLPKDEGLDLVAWKTFGDQRLGKLFLLGQCACGNDWHSKFHDLTKEKLEKWLNPITYTEFLRCFSIPYHIPGHHVFAQVGRQGGLVFDRTRLAIIAEKNSEEFDPSIIDRMKEVVRECSE